MIILSSNKTLIAVIYKSGKEKQRQTNCDFLIISVNRI